MLVNPKPTSYAFGEKLPSAHVNSVWSQLVYAVDGNGGGSYSLTNPLSIIGNDITLGSAGNNTTLAADQVTVSGPLVLVATPALFAGMLVSTGDVNVASGRVNALGGDFAGPIVLVSTGRVRKRTVTLGDASVSITPQDADVYYMPTGVQTTARTLTINDASCADGDEMWVFTHETSNLLTVSGITPFGSLSLRFTSGDQWSVKLIRIGGLWRMAGFDELN